MAISGQVVIAEPSNLPAHTEQLLKKFGPLRFGPYNRDGLVEAVREAAVLMVRLRHQVDAELLDAAPALRLLISATTGHDHIDLDACGRRQIELVSLRGETEFLETITSTAELALALILDLARKITAARNHVGQGLWDREQFLGRSVKGQILGIIGLGRLGRMMAAYAKALGMEVIASDPAATSNQGDVSLTTLVDLLRKADIVSIHATHDPGNPPILTRDLLATCKPGTIIVNTARGELVDEMAIHDFVVDGRIGGYGADVLRNEQTLESVRSHPLVKLMESNDRVIITPHIGGAASDAMERAERFVVEKALNVWSAVG